MTFDRADTGRLFLLWLALAVSCGPGGRSQVPAPALVRSTSPVIEVSKPESPPRQLDVAETNDHRLRVAAILSDGLHVFVAPADGEQWRSEETYSGVTLVALVLFGFPFPIAVSNNQSLGVLETDGTFRVLVDGLKPNEQVTELQILTGLGSGVVAMIEERRGGEPARVRVVQIPFVNGAWRPLKTIAVFDASPGQSAMRACSTGDGAALAVVSNLTRETGRRLSMAATLFLWQMDTNGDWHRSNDLLGGAAEQRLGTTLTFSPGSLDIRCRGREAFDLLFRSGAGWLMRSSDGGGWNEPLRVLPYAPGYGTVGRSVAFCLDRLVWIDNRLERGTQPKPWNPTGGFPWSDNYPGWGINSVFMERVDALLSAATGAKPVVLSSELGRQNIVTATSVGNDCVVVWSGQTKVPKAGATPEELMQRIMMTRVSP